MVYSYKQILLISLPVMMSILIEQLINITDAVFLGHVGEVELGAAAIAGIWYLAVYMLGFGFSLGLQVVIARRNGEGRYADVGLTFFQGLLFLSALAVALCAVTQLLSPWLLGLMVRSDDVYRAVTAYLDWRVYGLLFSFPLLALRALLVGITQTRALNLAAMTAVVVNIPGNWLLIFGLDMGISGAAIASSLAELCSLIVLSAYVARHINMRKYGLRPVADRRVMANVLGVSVWSMFHSFIGVASWMAFFVAIEHLGEAQLAATNVIRSVSTLFFVIVNSFATVTGSLVSNLIGNGEGRQVSALLRRVIRLGYATGLPLIIAAVALRPQVIGLYTDSTAVTDEAWLPYMVMLANYMFALPGYVLMNAVIGTGATKATFLFQTVAIVIYQIYLLYLSWAEASLAEFWTAEYLYVILLGIQSAAHLSRRRSSLIRK